MSTFSLSLYDQIRVTLCFSYNYSFGLFKTRIDSPLFTIKKKWSNGGSTKFLKPASTSPAASVHKLPEKPQISLYFFYLIGRMGKCTHHEALILREARDQMLTFDWCVAVKHVSPQTRITAVCKVHHRPLFFLCCACSHMARTLHLSIINITMHHFGATMQWLQKAVVYLGLLQNQYWVLPDSTRNLQI